jgi:hypothetical protein
MPCSSGDELFVDVSAGGWVEDIMIENIEHDATRL